MGLPANLEPKKVMYYFEEISKIPRGSGNEKQISDYVVQFAKDRGLEVHQDEKFNVIVKKDATNNKENSPTIMLQGHMDMVCEKNASTFHNFEKEGIKLRVEDDFIKATDTTLGADNGIAIAFMLAILDDNAIEHPKLECIMTTNEETGMDGALNLDTSKLEGKHLINLDSEDEGKMLVSCAGGAKVKLELPLEFVDIDQNHPIYEITIRGLKGGHSGEDINKSRANSNKLMARILYAIKEEVSFHIIAINGGAKDNAIPRECDVTIYVNNPESDIIKIKDIINKFQSIVDKEFDTSDPDIKIQFNNLEKNASKSFTEDVTDKIINAMNIIPNGIETMSTDIDGLVQSSLNLGVVETFKENIIFTLALRSSVYSLLQDIYNQLKIISKLIGMKMKKTSEYPAWEYKKDSILREAFKNTYKEMYGKDMEVKAIHAGLECGIFAKKINNVDIVAMGPNMNDIHTPEERLSISSTKRTWELLINVLNKL